MSFETRAWSVPALHEHLAETVYWCTMLQSKFSAPDPRLVAEFESLRASRSKIKRSLKSIETTLRELRTLLAVAEVTDDEKECKRLKLEISKTLREKELETEKV